MTSAAWTGVAMVQLWLTGKTRLKRRVSTGKIAIISKG
jgi:hypothetical protein